MTRIGVLSGVVLLVVLALSGCSGGGGGTSGLHVTPSSRTALPGGTVQFSSTVPVVWSVQEAYGGSITQGGAYTAPPVTGTFHVLATSQVEPVRTVSTAITVAVDTFPDNLTARPLADAAYVGHSRGANLVRWPSMSGRVVAYLIYRESQASPIAVVDGATRYYLDTATPLPDITDVAEAKAYSIEIDEQTGIVTGFNATTTYETDTGSLNDLDLTSTQNSLDVTARRVPLQAGQSTRYMVQVAYMEYDPNLITDPLQHPGGYRLFVGYKSAATPPVTLTEPPSLDTPANDALPVNGQFHCERVPMASSCLLQVSSSTLFPPDRTISVPATIESPSTALGTVSLDEMYRIFTGAASQNLYWRFGARVDGGPFPGILSYPNADAWVFSMYRTFTLPWPPPAPG